ncbi:glycosyltransferase family 2 protein [Ruminiclostridium cellobioparum]|uniref:glycosyltransferase family 2 protein n=1 Tax=Ruminiclostridium cellobioparum TaxID=29355 RepID=UPI0028AD370B|nr:glycosyltransferase family 2 protein [Ruminiclostridium cellobioparum]
MLYVFTCAYNSEGTLHRCVNSILQQTYSDFLYYILDNGSTDNTKEILEEYARYDKRIKPIFNKSNQCCMTIHILKNIFQLKCEESYFCTLDADDEYSPDFLKKMMTFISEYSLDVATCGTSWMEQKTGKIIKQKVLERNIILEDKEFATQFPEYRNFMVTSWCGIYSINVLKRCNFNWYYNAMNFADTAFAMEAFRKAKHAGVFAESLHKYYISSKTDSYKYNPKWFYACKNLIEISREYLLDYGEISKKNEDYLYVLLLILIKYILPRIQNAEVDLAEKLKCLNEIFSDKMTQYILKYWHEVGIYSDKGEFLRDINDWIKSQDGWEKERSIVKKIISLMNI